MVFLGSLSAFIRASSLISAPNISCGERQEEIFLRNSGYLFSQYFTHAGQQEVNSGRLSPDSSRSTSSLDSSITVKSAPKFVSYTSSNPILRSAATRRPSAFSPFLMPNLSPTATRTAGAICATTRIFLSARIFHTGSTSCLMLIAPVGHTARHCPQPTQSVSERFLLNAGVTCILEPRNAKSKMPSP